MNLHVDHNLDRYPLAQLGLADTLGAVIEGQFVLPPNSDLLEVEDPSTGLAIAKTVDSDAELVDYAVSSANNAYKNIWSSVAPGTRARILYKIGEILRAEAELLSRAESVDSGKPLSQARSDVQTAINYFEFYAGLADKITGETLPQPKGSFAYTLREPYGVTAHITPWNSPISQMARGVAPSLAAGNAVVVKPSELTPITSLYAALLFVKAGLPPGVCNVIPGSGAGTGATLASHPLVRHISFTGSVPTGRKIMSMAAERIIPCSLELGGKSPTIILPDADLEAAAQAGASAVVRNSGQSCFATTRLLVHRSLHDQFVEEVVKRIEKLRVGRGLDDPDLGPLISSSQQEKVRGYLNLAHEEGAEVIQPSISSSLMSGHFEMPAVLVGVNNNMRVAREEIFGPVQCILTFDDEEEAVAIANDSEYGLVAGLFTKDLSAAHRIASRLEVGQVQINKYPAGGVDTPFGGYKQSGIGREKGAEALRHYTQLKTVIIAL